MERQLTPTDLIQLSCNGNLGAEEDSTSAEAKNAALARVQPAIGLIADVRPDQQALVFEEAAAKLEESQVRVVEAMKTKIEELQRQLDESHFRSRVLSPLTSST